MPVTEIATLRLLPSHTWESPTIQAFFKAFSDGQTEFMGSPSSYFQDAQDQSVVYVVKAWESVSAHGEWIASAPNQGLLEMAKGLLEVRGLMHVNIKCMVTHDPALVWTVRKASEGDIVTAAEDTGTAFEDEEVVCSLKGYTSETAALEAANNGEKQAVVMRRLSLII